VVRRPLGAHCHALDTQKSQSRRISRARVKPGRREGLLVLTGPYDPHVPPLDFADDPTLLYETPGGQAWVGDSVEALEDQVVDESVDLIMTSPPFALQRPKEYGNESQESYVDWFLPFADEFWRVLKPTGSLSSISAEPGRRGTR